MAFSSKPNSAIFPLFVDAIIGEIKYRFHKLSKARIFMAFQHSRTVVYATLGLTSPEKGW